MTRSTAFFFSGIILILSWTACSLGPKTLALEPESRDFYAKARLVMAEAEKEIFLHLPDAASRLEFITDFWAKRDPDPATEDNEFRDEFERRVDHADLRFNEGRKGMDTDRGRIYIYLGPPDKTEEFPFQTSTEIRGPILWWIYYGFELGISFVDARNTGVYKISEIEGNLLDAIERSKLGAVNQSWGTDGPYFDFDVTYDRSKKALVAAIPVKTDNIIDNNGLWKGDFAFIFYIYKNKAPKEKFVLERSYETPVSALDRERRVVFKFPYDLPPGKTYLDVILTGPKTLGQARKIFMVKN
jgi:GWxTD domain-containing protein